MPTIHRIGRSRITVYRREHGVPHFHVERPEGRASVAIETLEIIVSDLPRRLVAPAIDWAAANRDQLMAAWRALHEGDE